MNCIQILSLFPEYFDSPLKQGVVGTAIQSGGVKVKIINPRDFARDKHKTVDDRPFGGGDGMVMKTEPLMAALDSLGDEESHVVMLSPAGRPLTVTKCKQYAKLNKPLTLICGRYAGVDQRFIQKHCHEELSVGDYILSGGEPAALVVIDSVVRLLPNVLGNEVSAENDSFFENLLECPSFTRPREIEGLTVPEELLSGDHSRISRFRRRVALLRTRILRPEMLRGQDLDEELREAGQWARTLSRAETEALGLEGIGKIFESES